MVSIAGASRTSLFSGVKPPFLSHPARVLTITLSLIGMLAGLGGWGLSIWIDQRDRAQQEGQLAAIVELQAAEIAQDLRAGDWQALERRLNALIDKRLSAYAAIFDLRTDAKGPASPLASAGQLPEPRPVVVERVIAHPDGPEAIARLTIAADTAAALPSWMRPELALAGFGMILFAAIGAVVILGVMRLLRPFGELGRVMHDLVAGKPDVLVPWVNQKDDLGSIARAVEAFKANVLKVKRMSFELRRIATKMTASLNKERELAALQREFVAMVSHEFRTPLAIIDGAASRVARRADQIAPDDLRERMNRIKDAIERLTSLINSTLNMTRLEEGIYAYEPREFDFAALVRDQCALHQRMNRAHDICFNFQDLPEDIFADPDLLSLVLGNLITNAIKFSPAGSEVMVRAWRDQQKLMVEVRDDGPGIPPEAISQIFDRFYRGPNSAGIPGTGIGLYLGKKLVEMHGGEIRAENRPAGGASLTFWLPLADEATLWDDDEASRGKVALAEA